MPCCVQSKMRLTLNREYEGDTRAPVKTPEYFPGRVSVVRSARLVTCVTRDGVTTCFGSSAR